jgi:hypothetical protein
MIRRKCPPLKLFALHSIADASGFQAKQEDVRIARGRSLKEEFLPPAKIQHSLLPIYSPSASKGTSEAKPARRFKLREWFYPPG